MCVKFNFILIFIFRIAINYTLFFCYKYLKLRNYDTISSVYIIHRYIYIQVLLLIMFYIHLYSMFQEFEHRWDVMEKRKLINQSLGAFRIVSFQELLAMTSAQWIAKWQIQTRFYCLQQQNNKSFRFKLQRKKLHISTVICFYLCKYLLTHFSLYKLGNCILRALYNCFDDEERHQQQKKEEKKSPENKNNVNTHICVYKVWNNFISFIFVLN